jgi:hypothetical protein
MGLHLGVASVVKACSPPVSVLSLGFDIFSQWRKKELRENRRLLQAQELYNRMAPLANSFQNRTIYRRQRAGEI